MNDPVIINSHTSFDPSTGSFLTLPEITLFMADRSVVADDKPVILNWEVENASAVFLNGKVVNKKGSHKFSCRETTNFILTATNEDKISIKRELIIEVDNKRPIIHFFRPDIQFAIKGSAVKLSWDIEGARNITIDNGVGDVTGLTSKTITTGSSGVYTITAQNYFGACVSEQLEFTIFPIPLIEGIFLPEPAYHLDPCYFERPVFDGSLLSFSPPLHIPLKLTIDMPRFTELETKIRPVRIKLFSIFFLWKRKQEKWKPDNTPHR